jgi:hypothetical protein
VVDEAAHHLRFAITRAGAFKSTKASQDVITLAKRYLEGAAKGMLDVSKAFVIYGRSGSGERALKRSIIRKMNR